MSPAARISVLPISTKRPPRGSSQGCVDEIAAQAVEHDVHALPTGSVTEGVGENERARRGDVLGVDPQIVENVMFVRVCGGEDFGAKVTGEWMAA